MAYSYGGRRTIQQFNEAVSQYGAPPKTGADGKAHPDYHYISDSPSYSGKIVDPLPADNDALHNAYGVKDETAANFKKWPGLYKDGEYNTCDSRQPRHFCVSNWTGIDCIGFTLQGLRYANNPAGYADAQMLNNSGDSSIPGIILGNNGSIVSDSALVNTNVEAFFNAQNKRDLLYFWLRSNKGIKFLHKGDLIQYKNKRGVSTHIATVNSGIPTCTTTGAGTPNEQTYCTYEVIHASGYDNIDFNGNGINDPDEFSRKVRMNLDIWMPEPTGFGRIKLW